MLKFHTSLQALLRATKGSLTALQERVSGLVPAPLFRVAVELSVPSVGLNPSSAAIQATIDTAAKQVTQSIFPIPTGVLSLRYSATMYRAPL